MKNGDFLSFLQKNNHFHLWNCYNLYHDKYYSLIWFFYSEIRKIDHKNSLFLTSVGQKSWKSPFREYLLLIGTSSWILCNQVQIIFKIFQKLKLKNTYFLLFLQFCAFVFVKKFRLNEKSKKLNFWTCSRNFKTRSRDLKLRQRTSLSQSYLELLLHGHLLWSPAVIIYSTL